MQPLTFALDGDTGALQIMRNGLLLAELSQTEQVQILAAVLNGHLTRLEHLRVNGHGPRPILDAITNPVA
jgi:hypothetical protein